MSLPALIDTEAFGRIEAVADLYVQGITSPYTIARRLGIKVVEAKQAIDHWHGILQEDVNSRDAARDALNVMLGRYDKLLQEANDNLSKLKDLEYDEKVSAQINASIKTVADLDKVRVDLLQKAGLLDASDLGDELAERERREEILLNILRNDLCESCKTIVRDRITEMTGVVEGTVVDE